MYGQAQGMHISIESEAVNIDLILLRLTFHPLDTRPVSGSTKQSPATAGTSRDNVAVLQTRHASPSHRRLAVHS
jgi:hypothetical protein